MIDLTNEQLSELQSQKPTVRDPRSGSTYVLVPTKVFERMAAVLDQSVCATGELVDEVMAEDDANDPNLEEYQRLYGDS